MTMQTIQVDAFIGKELDGYLIEELLGHGGMARVYRALDTKLKRYAAIKILTPTPGSFSLFRRRFEGEARAVAMLKHPHIVAIHRFNNVNGAYYIAMEYIDGADLRWVLRDYRANSELMDYQTMLTIIRQIGDALDYAHEHGVIHRDVKPANIMITRQGDAVLTDFNLARITSEDTAGEAFGSPHYISPEQAVNASEVVPQSDLYSLGVVLYEILTGDVPFNSESVVHVLAAHVGEELPDPRTRVPDLHPAFVDVLDQALAKEPEDRYSSGKMLADALSAAVEVSEMSGTQPPSISDTSPADRITLLLAPRTSPHRGSNGLFSTYIPPTRRRRVIVVLAAMLVIALGIGAAIRVLRPTHSADKAPSGGVVAPIQAAGQDVSIPAGRALAPSEVVLQRLVWSADGRYIAGAGADGSVMVWEAQGGSLVHHWQAHEAAVTALAWSPDDQHVLVTGGADALLRVWKVDDTVEMRQTLDAHGQGIVALAWSADGKQIISGDQSSAIIRWDVANNWAKGNPRYTRLLQTLDWSSDGTRFVSGGGDYGIRLWDTGAGSNTVLGSHEAPIRAVDWGPLNQLVAAVSDDGDVRLWSADSGAYIRLAQNLSGPADIHFNFDETRVAAAHGAEISVWDVPTGIRVAILTSADHLTIRSLDWSPDGTELAVAMDTGAVEIWPVPSALPVRFVSGDTWTAHNERVNLMTWDAAGDRLATVGDDGTLVVWDAASHKKLFAQGGDDSTQVSSVAWMPGSDGLAIGRCDGSIVLIDMDRQNVAQQMSGHQDCVNQLAFSPDGRYLWSTDTTGQLFVWTQAGMYEAVLMERKNLSAGSSRALISTGGTQFVTVDEAGVLQIWTYEQTGLQTDPEPPTVTNPVTAGSWNASENALLIGDAAGGIAVWHWPFSSNTRDKFSQLPAAVQAVGGSPTGRYLAGIDQNGCLTFWAAATAEKLWVQCEPSGQTYSRLAWSPSVDDLAAGTEQGQVVFWHVP